MKQAVIRTGGKQYLVKEGETLEVELLNSDKPSSRLSSQPAKVGLAPEANSRKLTTGKKSVEFEPLLVIDGEKVSVGTPLVVGAKVAAEIVEAEVKGEKVVAIRYKAKKRVRKTHGHRQRHSLIKIKSIS